MEFMLLSATIRDGAVEILTELIQQMELDVFMATAVLVLARIAPLVVLAPFLGGSTLSPAVRTVVVLALTVAVFPAASEAGPSAIPNAALLMVLLAKEAMVGVALGLLAAIAFHTLSMAGQLVDQARGATLSQVQNPATGDEQSPLASLHFQLGVVLFLIMGGHRAFLAAAAGSYHFVPLMTFPIAPEGLEATAILMARLFSGAFAAAVLLAAPAVTAIMLTDLALGLLGRAAPQLGTYFMAMPLRATMGLMMTLFAMTMIVGELLPQLGQLATWIERAAQLFQHAP